MNEKMEVGVNGTHSTIKKDDMDTLTEYCRIFDKLIVSKNPAVHQAWKDLSLLLVMTETDADLTVNTKKLISPVVEDSKRSMPEIFLALARQVERAGKLEHEMIRHINGLQYQIDTLKKEMRQRRSNQTRSAESLAYPGPVGYSSGAEGCDSAG